jgi:hyperosmotically inducible protein
MKLDRKHVLNLALAAAVVLPAAGCATWNRMTGDGGSNMASKDSAISTSNEPTGTHRSLGRTAEDDAITARVKAAFVADKTVKAHAIDVDTNRGVVTLKGTVASPAERDQAIAIANRTPGVFEVRDQLKVSG